MRITHKLMSQKGVFMSKSSVCASERSARGARSLLRGASRAPLIALLAAVPLAAAAQDAERIEPADEESRVEQTIVVTGSRISNANLTSPSPVTTVGADQIQTRGTVRVEDMLNTLPQINPSEGAGRANEAAGTANVDLRGLGAERTLVLVDGQPDSFHARGACRGADRRCFGCLRC